MPLPTREDDIDEVEDIETLRWLDFAPTGVLAPYQHPVGPIPRSNGDAKAVPFLRQDSLEKSSRKEWLCSKFEKPAVELLAIE